MKLSENVRERSLNAIFFAELNLITSFSIYESLRKKWRVQCYQIVKRVIKFLNAEGITGSEIHHRLSNVGACNVISLRHIYK